MSWDIDDYSYSLDDHLYVLDGHEPVPARGLEEWAKAFGYGHRHVADTMIAGVRISTVFLGMDHSFSLYKEHVPILFETMIFGGKHDQYQKRYATWDEAERGHAAAVALARSGLPIWTRLWIWLRRPT